MTTVETPPEKKPADLDAILKEVQSARIGIHLIAWIVGICFAATVITGIVVGVQVAHAVNQGAGVSSSCTAEDQNLGIC